jgi:glycosyltransferase involved in cell wall biosynthesis
VTRLVELYPEHRFVVYVADDPADTTLLGGADVRRVALARPPGSAEVWEGRTVSDILRLTRAVLRDRPDVVLCPSLRSYLPVPRAPVVVGILDAVLRDAPSSWLPDRRDRIAFRIKSALALRTAARLFTISTVARDEVARAYGIAAERLTVVPLAADPVFRPRSPAEVEAARRLAGLGEDEPIVVCACGFDPHKNLGTLVSAFASVRLVSGRLPRLVIAGRTLASEAAALRARTRELGLGERVVLPGFVSDDVLAALYTGAQAAVVPSLTEGFGLPAVEAAACGSPVILSDIPAHRETIGDAGLFFRPTDADALQRLLERVIADEALQQRLGEAARETVGSLTWDAAAVVLERLLCEAARG